MEKKRVLGELKKQSRLAGPLVLATGIQFILQLISYTFVGHLGELALSGASIATSLAVATGFSFVMGMSTALDTLCGQAYGAKQYHMIGIHTQRAMIMLTLMSIPLAVLWSFTEPILLGLHQDPQISKEAGIYARWLIPSLFGFGFLQCYTKFLQTQNIVVPLLLSSCFVAVLHAPLCWILVFKLDLGTKGAAVALTISYWLNAFLLSLYVKLSPVCKASWTGVSRKALHDIWYFMKLAIPSTGMICLQYWAFELLVILAGLLPNPKLATSLVSIILNTVTLINMISWGVCAAVSTRVSNELGAGNPQAARLAIFTSVVIIIFEGATVCVFLICIRNIWGRVYTNEMEVVKHIAGIVPILALGHLVDGINNVLQGTARGCGWQKFCVFINIMSYYIVGIPISLLFGFLLHLGAKGLWIGMICASAVQILILATIILCTDWNKEVKKASDRVNGSDKANGSAISLDRVDGSDRVNGSAISMDGVNGPDKVDGSAISLDGVDGSDRVNGSAMSLDKVDGSAMSLDKVDGSASSPDRVNGSATPLQTAMAV